jgi:hypothetical protein
MSATDSAERGRAEPIDVEFEPAERARVRARGAASDRIGIGTALALASLSALLGAGAGAIAPRIEPVDAALDRLRPDGGPSATATAPASANSTQVAGLDQRLRAIEALVGDPTAAAAGADAGVSQRVLALQAGLRNVEGQLQQIPSSQEIQRLVAEVQRLNAELPAVAQESRTAGQAARAAFAVSAVAEASRSSGPFEPSYRSLVALMPDDANVRALSALARTGAPTRMELRDNFVKLEDEIIRAARQAEAGAGFWGRVQAALAQWIIVRREGEGDTAVGVVERAGRRLAADDLAGSVQELSRLSGAPARVANPWLAQARRRLEIDMRLAAIRTELSRGT